MHLHTYKDDQKSWHFDLVRDGENPGSFDLVSVAFWVLLVVGVIYPPHLIRCTEMASAV
jgi:hypothetical protein